jgi:hypothetical protein
LVSESPEPLAGRPFDAMSARKQTHNADIIEVKVAYAFN